MKSSTGTAGRNTLRKSMPQVMDIDTVAIRNMKDVM